MNNLTEASMGLQDNLKHLNKDQRYRARHLAVVRAKDRERATKRRRDAKASQGTSIPHSGSLPLTVQAPLTETSSGSDPAVQRKTTSLPLPNYHGTCQEILTEARTMVWEWTKERGDVFYWPQVLNRELEHAQCNGTIKRVFEDWRAHASVGRTLLKDLRGLLNSRWPENDSGTLRNMMRQAIDLAGTLERGIALLDAYTEFVAIFRRLLK